MLQVCLRLSALVLLVVVASSQMKEGPRELPVDEIQRSVVLIGRLGRPLGQKMVVVGKWQYPAELTKDGNIRFVVSEVNETPLPQPYEFNVEQMIVRRKDQTLAIPELQRQPDIEGQEWRLVAFETGEVRIRPDERADESRVFPVVAEPYYTRAFTSRLEAVLVSVNRR